MCRGKEGGRAAGGTLGDGGGGASAVTASVCAEEECVLAPMLDARVVSVGTRRVLSRAPALICFSLLFFKEPAAV